MAENWSETEAGRMGINKKRQATYIAPLQPPTLATFRSWGSSAGAGRVRPAGANIEVLKPVVLNRNFGVENLNISLWTLNFSAAYSLRLLLS